ncbi:MAG: ABC transporter substrate-binding protein [Clostridia bacterium]
MADDYSQGLTEFFEKHFVEKGGEIVAKEAFKFGDVDFRPQLSKIKEAGPEIIFMPYYYKEVALSANQARELGIDAVLMGGDGWPSEVLLEMAKDAVEGCYFRKPPGLRRPGCPGLQSRLHRKIQPPGRA